MKVMQFKSGGLSGGKKLIAYCGKELWVGRRLTNPWQAKPPATFTSNKNKVRSSWGFETRRPSALAYYHLNTAIISIPVIAWSSCLLYSSLSP